MLRFDKAVYLSFLLKSMLSVRLSDSLGDQMFYYFQNS